VRVGMLLDHNFPGDNRVEREASALLQAGHQVTIVFFKTGVERPGFGYKTEEARLIEAACPRLPALRGLYKALAAYFLLVRWGRRLGWGAVHCHDLPLMAPAVLAARKLKVPLVFDSHENYPGLVQSWGRLRQVRGRLWRAYEGWAAARARAVLTVVEEMRQRLAGPGRAGDKFLVLPNSASPRVWDSFGIDRAIVDRYQGRRVITYSGTYGRHKGVDLAVEAAALIKDRFPDLLLVILADSQDPLRFKLEARAARLGLKNNVEIAGWQPFDKLPSFYEASFAGLVPQAPSLQTEASWPNKLNEIALAGKPVVAADNRSLKRLVESHGLGLTFRAGDRADLAAKLAWLLDNPREAARMGQQGRAWARGRGSWDVHQKILIDLYARLEMETP